MLRNLCIATLLVGAFLWECQAAPAASPTLSESEAKQAIESYWDGASFVTANLGSFSLGTIHDAQLRRLQDLQELGALTLEKAGTRIVVQLAPEGQSLNVSGEPGLMMIPMGSFTVDHIVSLEQRKHGDDDVAILAIEYTANWTDFFRKYMSARGLNYSSKRKARVLLRYYSAGSLWVLVTSDVADKDQDFTSDWVGRALR